MISSDSNLSLVHSMSSHILGGYCDGVPPLPIPNREVKPVCADGTAMQCGRVGSCLLYQDSWKTIRFPRVFFLFPLSSFILQLSTFNLQPSTFNLNPSTFIFQPSTLNSQLFNASALLFEKSFVTLQNITNQTNNCFL